MSLIPNNEARSDRKVRCFPGFVASTLTSPEIEGVGKGGDPGH